MVFIAAKGDDAVTFHIARMDYNPFLKRKLKSNCVQKILLSIWLSTPARRIKRVSNPLELVACPALKISIATTRNYKCA